jgi:surface protein
MPILEEEPYVNEITSSSEIIVAEYKFNNTVTANYLPTFYDGYNISRVVDTIVDTITTRKVIATESPSEMYFTGSTALVEVLDVDISNMVETKQMFENCSNLTHVKLGDEPTPKLMSMERMFNLCKKLVSIDFGGLTTDNLEFLSATFSDCAAITSIPVSDWNVKKVTSLAATFRRCSKLVDLDLSNWEIDNLIYASGTFTNDYVLKSLNLSKVNVENLENAQQMFYGCRALTELDLSTWKIPPNAQLTFLVGDCQKLETLDISNFNIAADNSYMTKFIYGSPKLEHIGMLYCNEETCNKVLSNMQAASGLVRKIYVTDTNSKQYAESNNYKFVDYDYKKETVRLELPKSLGVNDKLYWDNDKQRYCINSNGEIIDTDITKRILLKGYNNIVVQMSKDNIVPPAAMSLRIPINNQ